MHFWQCPNVNRYFYRLASLREAIQEKSLLIFGQNRPDPPPCVVGHLSKPNKVTKINIHYVQTQAVTNLGSNSPKKCPSTSRKKFLKLFGFGFDPPFNNVQIWEKTNSGMASLREGIKKNVFLSDIVQKGGGSTGIQKFWGSFVFP